MFGPRNPPSNIGEGDEYELRPDAERLYDLEADRIVVAWRFKFFLALGFSILHADALALRPDVDRVYVEGLVKAGATPEQVVEIVL